ncbi:hypothetical protein AAVH_16058 [Aphelenchoides avenae]|nr:hypothetical protein AAVH_16058 [Aphelenchus avenae]
MGNILRRIEPKGPPFGAYWVRTAECDRAVAPAADSQAYAVGVRTDHAARRKALEGHSSVRLEAEHQVQALGVVPTKRFEKLWAMEQASKKLRGGRCTCLTELEVAAKVHPGLLQEEQAPQQAVEQEPADQCASIRARQCVPPVVLTICTASLTSFVSARKMPVHQEQLVAVHRAAVARAN